MFQKIIGYFQFYSAESEEKSGHVKYAAAAFCFVIIFSLSVILHIDKSVFYDTSTVFMSILDSLHRMGVAQIALIDAALLAAVLCLRQKRNLEAKSNWYISLLWYTWNILFVTAGLTHNIGSGYLLSQVIIMIALPLLYRKRKDGGIAELLDSAAMAVIAVMLAVTVIHMICFPYGSVTHYIVNDDGSRTAWQLWSTYLNRYRGITSNPNILGEFMTMGILSSLYLIYRDTGKKYILYAIVLGFCIGQAVMSISRTALLSEILLFVAWMILYGKSRKGFRKFLLILLIAVLSALLTYFIINRGTDNYGLLSSLQAPVAVYAADGSSITQRLEKSTDLNTFSSGRIEIWKIYLDHLNMGGHDVSYSYPIRVMNTLGNGYNYYSLAHNVALEYAYRCGIPTGILFLAQEILSFAFCIRVIFMRRNKMKDEYVFSVLAITAFLVTGSLEPISEVFTRPLLLIYYLALLPIFGWGAANEESGSRYPGTAGQVTGGRYAGAHDAARRRTEVQV